MNKNNSELLTRGISAIYPSIEFLQSKINKKEKLTIYLGVDPTGPDLHLGHVIVIKKLRDFQKAGHKIILLMGDFTAMIGDPTDKSAARVQLTHKQVMANLKNYKKQASTLLSFSGKNAAQIKFNSKWLSKMNFEKVLTLASKMTVQQMLERDMFDKRQKEGKPIFIHEFMYPLMQGYDSVAMDVDGEIGGNDQTFNMLCGRDLMKTIKGKEKFVITMKLLEDPTGKKMGKTEGNIIALSDTPDEMYGKVMSWTDGMIVPGFELCTDKQTDYIDNVSKKIKEGIDNPRDLKMELAKEIITLLCGEKSAKQAEDSFIKKFQKNEIPTEVEKVEVGSNDLLVDVLLAKKIISSKGEFRRLVEEKAVTNLDTEEKITNVNEKVKNGVYRIGKKRFCKIKITN